MVKLKDVCTVDWGNTNLTKSSYKPDGQYLAVSATGGDGRIENFEHEVGVTVLSAIGANCGKVFSQRKDLRQLRIPLPSHLIGRKYYLNIYFVY